MDSSFDLEKRPKKACMVTSSSKIDLISELPDDILIRIVSLLKMKESVKTSVLSKRWKNVWEYMTTLNFDAFNIIGNLLSACKRVKCEPRDNDRFCDMVEHVLRSNKASIIDEFRANHYLNERRKENIDNWIRFVIEKRVKSLKLHFESFNPFPIINPYNFPNLSFGNMLTSIELASVNVTGEYLERLLNECQSLEVMSIENSSSLVNLKVAGPLNNLKSLRIESCLYMKRLEIFAPSLTSFYFAGPKCRRLSFMKAFNLFTFLILSSCNMLTSVELANVDVNGEFLEKILYECQFLEVMSIKNCFSLVNLNVVGPALSLKSLKLISCDKMKHLEIFAPNLTSCYYVGPELESPPFKSTPKLNELCIGGSYANLVFSRVRHPNLSSCISQTEVLTLDLSDIGIEVMWCGLLHVKINLMSEEDLFAMHLLLKACPLLSKFVFEISSVQDFKPTGWTLDVGSCLYNHLAIVEVIGFVGGEAEMAFATYLLENASLLKKIIIKPTEKPSFRQNNLEERRRRAIEQAEKLSTNLSTWTELHIIR